MTDHPPSEELAAYLSGKLGAQDRATMENHLVQCQPCRREITTARSVLYRQSPGHRLRWTPLALAAGIVAIILYSPARPAGKTDILRGNQAPSNADDQRRVTVLRPAENGQVQARDLEFRWEPAGDGAIYRLELRDAEGSPVWQSETHETFMRLDTLVVLQPGSTYLWYVDALRADGQSLTSGTMRFSIAP